MRSVHPAMRPPLPAGAAGATGAAAGLACTDCDEEGLDEEVPFTNRLVDHFKMLPGKAVQGADMQPLAVAVVGGGVGAVSWHGQMTWLRALWYTEYRLAFTSCGPAIELSEDGAWLCRESCCHYRLCCCHTTTAGLLIVVLPVAYVAQHLWLDGFCNVWA